MAFEALPRDTHDFELLARAFDKEGRLMEIKPPRFLELMRVSLTEIPGSLRTAAVKSTARLKAALVNMVAFALVVPEPPKDPK